MRLRFGSGRWIWLLALLVVALPTVAEIADFEEKTEGLERREGFLPVWLDADGGTVWLELEDRDGDGLFTELLYVEGLRQGMGSNPVGLDRGQLGEAVLLRLRRVGNRVLFEQPNLAYRAESDDAAEVKAVRDSFATSVIWAAPIAAANESRVLIDLRGFLVRDAHSVVGTLQRTGQGSFRLDEKRSAIDLAAVMNFPKNLELEALLTYAGDRPGAFVRDVTPTPQSISLVQHHSLIALPEPGYVPRRFDPRAGNFAVQFADYAVPLDAPMDQRWIVRHRLEKTDPTKKRSRVKEPIVYYLDPGTPEPVRQALLDGARWWAESFEAAGFIDAYRVEMLPEDAHPLDVRYNVIQWVHRSTRGWSYGGGVVNPRTGEMLKGHVSLGSLRVRQDRLMFEALLGAANTGSGGADDPIEIALARIRQLSAHEVGHTLGITHNFAASTYGRASVMDYPAPWIRLKNGKLDASEAYGVGIGAWDTYAVRYAYTQFAPGADEAAELEAIVQDGLKRGYHFVTDADARPAGASQPIGHLWDNGEDPIVEWRERLAVRAHALERFGVDRLGSDRPLALLEESLATVYFHHRFQLDAVAKLVGGIDYRYAMPGDGQQPVRPVDGARQREALAALLELLEPQALDLPESVLKQLPPRPFGYGSNRELFNGRMAMNFDALSAASSAADQLLAALTQHERASRIVDQHRRDPSLPGYEQVLQAVSDQLFADTESNARHEEIRTTVAEAWIDRLAQLAHDERAVAGVRARTLAHAQVLQERLGSGYLGQRLKRALYRPAPPLESAPNALPLPPGSPIGSWACTHD